MAKAAHTPGPWRVGEMGGGTINIEADTTPRHITVGRVHVFDTQGEAEANARLIAVAPRLLMHARGAWHLCQSILATREGATDDLIRELADALQADIAAAEGR